MRRKTADRTVDDSLREQGCTKVSDKDLCPECGGGKPKKEPWMKL